MYRTLSHIEQKKLKNIKLIPVVQLTDRIHTLKALITILIFNFGMQHESLRFKIAFRHSTRKIHQIFGNNHRTHTLNKLINLTD